MTLAEGIETHAQLEGLRSEQCDQGQGFLFSGPVDAAEMAALLDTAQAGQPAAAVGAGPVARAPRNPALPPGPATRPNGAVDDRAVGRALTRKGSRSSVRRGAAAGRAQRSCVVRGSGQSPSVMATAASGSITRKLKLSSR